MIEDNERFKRPAVVTSKKGNGRASPLKDNGLLFDRPWSYWTIAVFGINAAFIATLAPGNMAPTWLNIAEPFAAIPWLFFFFKGGAWDWFKRYIPEQKAKETDKS